MLIQNKYYVNSQIFIFFRNIMKIFLSRNRNIG